MMKSSESLIGHGLPTATKAQPVYHLIQELKHKKQPKPRWIKLAALIAMPLVLVAPVTMMNISSDAPLSSFWLEVKKNIRHISTLAGFNIQQIQITGHQHTKEQDVMQALGTIWNYPLFEIDTKAAKAQVETLPWIKRASVERLFPDALNINIEERKPFALFQEGKNLYLIDETGLNLELYQASANKDYPLFIGKSAGKFAKNLWQNLSRFKDLRPQVVSMHRIEERRWDLKLKSGLKILLPEKNVALSLSKLDKLNANHQILLRDLEAIDLRLPDRVTLKLKPKPIANGPES